MPFTFSHPAIVLPLISRNRKLFSATGLIIGSIIPDFESFIFLNEFKIYGHTWPGIFWFDLPLAIIVAFIFHGIVRDPLISNLPAFICYKFARFINFRWGKYFRRHFLTVIISILIGTFSHLLWDAFTHLNLADPNSRESKLILFNHRLYTLLQYSTSLLGLLVVAWYIIDLPQELPGKVRHGKNKFRFNSEIPASSRKMQYWIIVALVASLMIVASFYFMPGDIGIILFIEICISGSMLGITVASIAQMIIPGYR